MILLYVLIFLIMPVGLTLLNGVYLFETFTVRSRISVFVSSKHLDTVTLVLGLIFTPLLWVMADFREYNEPIQIPLDLFNLHTPINGENLLTVIVLACVGIVGYLGIKYFEKKLSPALYALCMSSIIISGFISIVVIIQISNHLFIDHEGNFSPISLIPFFGLLPVNFIMCSVSLLTESLKAYGFSDHSYDNQVLDRLSLFVIKTSNMTRAALVFVLPLYAVLTIILALFGQRPDSIIKAFTETSDWTLSQQVSPPPVEMDDHYLCTVSLRGHKKFVKPVRYGIRRGNRIVINRQLMVANAFEELIQVKFPKSHKVIRHVYDKYGYPLSKHITTSYRADMIYLLMKPLEYVFLAVLYLFDSKPENRIAMQYLPVDVRKRLSQSL